MKKLIEHVIRKWLKQHNYLFSSNEIIELSEMIEKELSPVDWADITDKEAEDVVGLIIKGEW